MGGGGHHAEPFQVPSYKVYNNWQAYPELVAHQERLGRLGLRDPWVRNMVHLFDRGNEMDGYRPHWRMFKTFTKGFWPGLALAVGFVLLSDNVLTPYFEEAQHRFAHGDHEAHHE